MIEIPGRIPIAIHPLFWVLAAFIGYVNSPNSFMGMAIWIGIIFVSVLFHELGHALTSLLFKQKAKIQLVALGGVTSYDGPKLKFWQQFLVVLNGPLFGFFLFLGATYLLTLNWTVHPIIYGVLKMTQLANLFWTIVNLLPVQPLDGGQLLRIILEASFGVKGFKASLLIGAILSVIFSFYFFMAQFYLGGALFFLFAFQSFDLWRKSKIATNDDRQEEHRKLLMMAEIALQEGKKDQAKSLFLQVCEKAKGGVLAASAAQYLAVLMMQEGKHEDAYNLLLPIHEHLADETKCLLHQLSAEYKNDALVAKLSHEAYQIAPSQELALRNARAFARLKEPKMAGGWVQAAWQYGGLDVAKILHEETFAQVLGKPEFEEFINKLK
jgi:stage IV sporulation protein FB